MTFSSLKLKRRQITQDQRPQAEPRDNRFIPSESFCFMSGIVCFTHNEHDPHVLVLEHESSKVEDQIEPVWSRSAAIFSRLNLPSISRNVGVAYRLPQTMLNNDETLAKASLRTCVEEGGLDARLQHARHNVNIGSPTHPGAAMEPQPFAYTTRTRGGGSEGTFTVAAWFLAKPYSGSRRLLPLRGAHKIEELKVTPVWLPVGRAVRDLWFQEERDLLRRAAGLLLPGEHDEEGKRAQVASGERPSTIRWPAM